MQPTVSVRAMFIIIIILLNRTEYCRPNARIEILKIKLCDVEYCLQSDSMLLCIEAIYAKAHLRIPNKTIVALFEMGGGGI